ncbi:hypothetical protein [Candidatus Avelusimicrobium fimicolum]|uniref:hypothetical protein n=1 Tax=Candidatus Avelusimicrobium fimicolum TaxID=3416216 RepID=UPI003D13F65B
MKKLLIGLCFLCASTPSMAAGANKMTMVTYFPVKYVAYSQVDVMKQMDVGLTSACQMNLGCSADEGFNTGKSLRVNNLLKIAGGKLELNDAPAIEGSTARIGSGNGVSDFDFKTSLRVGNYKQGYTLQADNMYLSELNLFGYKFPKCEGETMSWQKLKLKNKEEVYLVCGEAEQGTCEPPADEPTKRACVVGTGTETRTWNYETCQWNDWKLNCKLTPTEDLYAWTLTDSRYQWMPQGVTCEVTCLINANQETTSGHPFLLPNGSLVTTTAAIIPECTSSNVGKTCKIGGIKAKTLEESDRYYYCPIYTCTKK